jgi:hypothetical protein
MKPDPHPGTGVVGVGAGDLPAAMFAEAARSFTLSHRIATLSAGAGLAFCALTANRALHSQVKAAYTIAGYARAQSQAIAGLSKAAVPPGPAREALLGSARLADGFADAVADSASRYGRAFGHLAFAFPLAGPQG